MQSHSIQELTDFSGNFHLLYPHSNGFTQGGDSVILTRVESERVSLWRYDLETGAPRKLCEFPRDSQPERTLWADVAPDKNLLVTIADNAIWLIDLNSEHPAPRHVYQPETGILHILPSINRSGTAIAFGLFPTLDSLRWNKTPPGTLAHPGNIFRGMTLDIATGTAKKLFEKTWMTNHFHFCPHDESWLGFSHEGQPHDVKDRVWCWHEKQAPVGRCVFDQKTGSPDTTLYAGHERWSHHDTSVFVVAYGVSPGEPCGVYESFPDGRPTRLVSPAGRDWHVDVSRCGRWAVVDTSGPHDLPGKGWEGSNHESDIILIETTSGRRHFLAHSRIGHSHPSHPHPVFSPDARFIYFNKADDSRTYNQVLRVANPLQA